jgi:hypothetical protein
MTAWENYATFIFWPLPAYLKHFKQVIKRTKFLVSICISCWSLFPSQRLRNDNIPSRLLNDFFTLNSPSSLPDCLDQGFYFSTRVSLSL